jgi:hypothetical protein
MEINLIDLILVTILKPTPTQLGRHTIQVWMPQSGLGASNEHDGRCGAILLYYSASRLPVPVSFVTKWKVGKNKMDLSISIAPKV